MSWSTPLTGPTPTMMYGQWLSLAGGERFAQALTFLLAATHSTPTGASDLGRRSRPSTVCRETVAVR
jgi:hypothetical protein